MIGSNPKQSARDLLAEAHPALVGLSHWIHANPELGYEEVLAAGWVAEWLATAGFDVRSGIAGMETAVSGSFGPGPFHVVICAEYDALPAVGHACGHNVIAAASVGAAIALATVAEELGLRVTLLGTPAEEGGGGKLQLIQAGAFEGVHAALMVHPGPEDVAEPNIIAVQQLEIAYTGREAHASAYPEEGINAADAMVIAQAAIGLMRQQLQAGDRVHGIVTSGGEAPNIIPAHTSARFMTRAADRERLLELTARVRRCFEAGALATGAELAFGEGVAYAQMDHDSDLLALYVRNAEELGRHFDPNATLTASTDMGDVSHVVPSIHPIIGIHSRPAVNHQPEFAAAAVSEAADQAIFDGALALAWTVIDAAQDVALRTRLTGETWVPLVLDTEAATDAAFEATVAPADVFLVVEEVLILPVTEDDTTDLDSAASKDTATADEWNEPTEAVAEAEPTWAEPTETVAEPEPTEAVAEVVAEVVAETEPTWAEPTEAVAEPEPTETVAEAAPTEAVAEAEPTEAVAEAEPTEAVAEAEPTEAVAGPEPIEAVAEVVADAEPTWAEPTETVAEPEPTEAVAEAVAEVVAEAEPTWAEPTETVAEPAPTEAVAEVVAEAEPTETVAEAEPTWAEPTEPVAETLSGDGWTAHSPTSDEQQSSMAWPEFADVVAGVDATEDRSEVAEAAPNEGNAYEWTEPVAQVNTADESANVMEWVTEPAEATTAAEPATDAVVADATPMYEWNEPAAEAIAEQAPVADATPTYEWNEPAAEAIAEQAPVADATPTYEWNEPAAEAIAESAPSAEAAAEYEWMQPTETENQPVAAVAESEPVLSEPENLEAVAEFVPVPDSYDEWTRPGEPEVEPVAAVTESEPVGAVVETPEVATNYAWMQPADAEPVEAVAEIQPAEGGTESEPDLDEPVAAIAEAETTTFGSWALEPAVHADIGVSEEPVAVIELVEAYTWSEPVADAERVEDYSWVERAAEPTEQPAADAVVQPAIDPWAVPAVDPWAAPVADAWAEPVTEVTPEASYGSSSEWHEAQVEPEADVWAAPAELQAEPAQEHARSWSAEHALWETAFADALAELPARADAWSGPAPSQDAPNPGDAEAESWEVPVPAGLGD